MYGEVLVEYGVKTLDKTFTYIIPNHLKDKIQIGMKVIVPFGTLNINGFLINIKDSTDIEELKDKVSDDEKEKVEKLVGELRDLVAGDDIAAIKEKSDELSEVVQGISAKIYQEAQAQAQAQQQADPNAGAQSNSSDDDDGTIDAEYEVKDD